MKPVLLSVVLTALFAASPLAAKLHSVRWGVTPQEIYANQLHTRTLTFEVDPGEEISEFRIAQGIARHADRQLQETRNGRNFITFCWDELLPAAGPVSIPESRIQAMVTRTYVQGFFRSSQSSAAQMQVPAFQYTVLELPPEAAGLPVGSFTLKLEADRTTFRPGEVRELRMTVTADSGAIPAGFVPAIADTPAGRCYPFRVIRRDRTQYTASARFVIAADGPFELKPAPLRVFDPHRRAVREITAGALTFTPHSGGEEEETASVLIGGGDSRLLPLRFSPAAGAPVIATVPPEKLIAGERREGWVRLASPVAEGWVPEALLQKLTRADEPKKE